MLKHGNAAGSTGVILVLNWHQELLERVPVPYARDWFGELQARVPTGR